MKLQERMRRVVACVCAGETARAIYHAECARRASRSQRRRAALLELERRLVGTRAA